MYLLYQENILLIFLIKMLYIFLILKIFLSQSMTATFSPCFCYNQSHNLLSTKLFHLNPDYSPSWLTSLKMDFIFYLLPIDNNLLFFSENVINKLILSKYSKSSYLYLISCNYFMVESFQYWISLGEKNFSLCIFITIFLYQ